MVATFEQLTAAFRQARDDPGFWQEYQGLMSTYSGRPTPLTYAENLSGYFGGPRICIKREDLNYTGAHKANNVMGQDLLVKRMGKRRVIAETGAGQHGVATATMAAKFGFSCTIYMGELDVARQRPKVFWMERLGATVVPVNDGSRILKDAINAALRDWAANMDDTHYVLGTACGPHPFLIMGYYNIAFKHGLSAFAAAMAACGLRGAIIPDLPPEEGAEYFAAMRSQNLAPILIYSPTTTLERMQYISSFAAGFIYCVARKGVTGQATDFSRDLETYLQDCRRSTSLPLAVGFGIKERSDIGFLRGKADIAVIGSQAIRVMEEDKVEAVGSFVGSLR